MVAALAGLIASMDGRASTRVLCPLRGEPPPPSVGCPAARDSKRLCENPCGGKHGPHVNRNQVDWSRFVEMRCLRG
jgi:hypothetical protein